MKILDPNNVIDNFLKKHGGFTLFGYNWKYLIFHPWVIVKEIFYEIKYAWQRVFRGWDDRAIWSIDYYLAELIPQLVLRLKEVTHGVPFAMFEEDDWDEEEFSYKDGRMEIASKRWDKVLEEIADGFIYYKENIYDSFGLEEVEEVQEKLNKSMNLLKEHYMSLWD